MVEKGRVKRYVNKFFGQVSWAVLTYPFVTAFIYLLALLTKALLGDKDTPYSILIKQWVGRAISLYESHPYWVILGSLFIGIIITSTITSRATLKKQELLIDSFGIHFFSEHYEQEQIQEDWQTFVGLIEEQNSQHLYILGATGQETFQNEQSPLYRLVREFQGELKVMLLDQHSDKVVERARAVNTSVPDYRKEIGTSISYLKEIYKSKAVMEVRTYSCLPSWKMIMTEQYLWLQYYSPGDHVDSTPVFGIYKNNNNYNSLYDHYFYDFHKKWDNGKSIALGA